MNIYTYGIVEESVVDGPGLRYALFVQGCKHNCQGCHNPDSHSFTGGKPITCKEVIEAIQANPLLDGITLTGGDPMFQSEALLPLVKQLRSINCHIMMYTGFTYEQILQLSPSQQELFSLCDMVVDGKFEIENRKLALLYCGSSNQRIINVAKSIQENKCIEYHFNEFGELLY